MKHTIKPGDKVYIIFNNEIIQIEISSQNKVNPRKFMVYSIEHSSFISVTYDIDMFLTRNKASKVLQEKIELKKEDRMRLVACDICGNISTSVRHCECRHGN